MSVNRFFKKILAGRSLGFFAPDNEIHSIAASYETNRTPYRKQRFGVKDMEKALS